MNNKENAPMREQLTEAEKKDYDSFSERDVIAWLYPFLLHLDRNEESIHELLKQYGERKEVIRDTLIACCAKLIDILQTI